MPATPHDIPPAVFARLAALDRRCDITMRRTSSYEPGTRWTAVPDARGIVRDHVPTQPAARTWHVTVCLALGNPADIVQTRAPSLAQALADAMTQAETRGWDRPIMAASGPPS